MKLVGTESKYGSRADLSPSRKRGRWGDAIPNPGFSVARPALCVALLVAVTSVACLAAGCAAPIDESWRASPRLPYRTVPPPETAPAFSHCNDRTGHVPGSTPWIFGGTCLCNPSIAVLDDYKASGILSTWAVATMETFYSNRGVTTLRDHRDCNNLCANGPHLLKGGRCLVPPTPGTLNWEEVVTGSFALPPWDFDRVAALGGPIGRESLPSSGEPLEAPTRESQPGTAASGTPEPGPPEAGPPEAVPLDAVPPEARTDQGGASSKSL